MFYLQKNVEMIQNLFTGNIHLFVNFGRSNESSSQVSGLPPRRWITGERTFCFLKKN